MDDYDFVIKEIHGYIKTKKYGRKILQKPKRSNIADDNLQHYLDGINDLENMVVDEIIKYHNEKELVHVPKGRSLHGNEIEKFCDLLEMNFSIGDKYITLTYEKANVSVDEAGKDFENWIKRMRERYGDFKYLAVRSFQRRGTIHFHVLATLPRIPKRQIQDGTFRSIWGHGNVDIKTIYNSQILDCNAKLKRYLIKNLREFKADERSYKKRLFLMSRNLEKPMMIKVKYEDFIRTLDNLGLELQEVESRCFSSDYVGRIEKKTYKVI